MSDGTPAGYVPIEYPKWVGGVIVADEAEEHAVLEQMTAPVAGPVPAAPDASGPAPEAADPPIEPPAPAP